MADLKYAVLRGVVGNSAAEAKNFTQSGFGTPAGAIVFISNANSTNNPQNDLSVSIGFWDGTNQRCCGMYSQDNVGTSLTIRDDSATRIGTSASSTSTPIRWDIANTTDGVTITVADNTSGVERHATVILLGGGDMTVDVGTLVAHATENSTASVTSLAAQPDVVLAVCTGQGSAGATNNALLSFGAATAAATQRATFGWSENSQGTSDAGVYFSESRIAGQVFNGSVNWTGEITAFAADGFTMTTRDGGSGSDQIYWLAINLGGGSAWLASLSTPTSTGDDAVTGPGFQPELLITAGCMAEAVDTQTAHNNVMYGATDDTTDSSVTVRDEDNLSTTDADSESNSRIVDIRANADGADLVAATLTSFDALGFTRNYSAVHTSAKLGWDLALQEGTAAGTANNLTLLGVG